MNCDCYRYSQVLFKINASINYAGYDHARDDNMCPATRTSFNSLPQLH